MLVFVMFLLTDAALDVLFTASIDSARNCARLIFGNALPTLGFACGCLFGELASFTSEYDHQNNENHEGQDGDDDCFHAQALCLLHEPRAVDGVFKCLGQRGRVLNVGRHQVAKAKMETSSSGRGVGRWLSSAKPTPEDQRSSRVFGGGRS